jgi:uncharacterized protein (TIGR03083 family)
MEPTQMTERIAALSAQMASDAEGNLDVQVEHCPDWTVAQLVSHIGDVQWFWSEILTNRMTDRSQIDISKRPSEQPDPIAWFRSQSSRLTAALDAATDADHIWTWWEPQQHVGFVRRRQLIEVAIHGWDARNATGSATATPPAPIPIDVSVLGLAEFIDVMSQDLRVDAPAPTPITLSCTDSSWTGTLFDGFTGSPTALTGTASDLLLTLWSRRLVEEPTIQQSLAAIDLS